MVQEILDRFQQIDKLIRDEKTGTPQVLAQTIGISERSIYQYLKQMKSLGAPIEFNNMTKNYYYKKEGTFICGFSFKEKNGKSKHAGPSKIKVVRTKKYIQMLNSSKTQYN